MELQRIVLLITFGPVSVRDHSPELGNVQAGKSGRALANHKARNSLLSNQRAVVKAEMNARECSADHYHSRFQDSFTLFVTRSEKQKPNETSIPPGYTHGLY